MRACIVVASLITLLAGCATGQQSASPVTSLESEIKHRRFVVLPRPTPEAVDQDVAAVMAELKAAEQREELVRQVIRPSLRPDLDDTVSGGIQSRNLGRALTR
ncbi:MAG TPA: hypothetical protein VLG10_12645 [Methylomirabilota bacterium]|nr:hypothetical protein [Methylomirabilota bacterium]